MILVVDASVLVELVVDGRHRSGADDLLDRYASADGLTLVTAAHGLVEALSALRRLTYRAALTSADGEAAALWLRELDLLLDATAPRVARIWSLRDQMSAYDAAYAAVAEALRCPLVTVDERLHRACRVAGVDAVSLDEVASLLD